MSDQSTFSAAASAVGYIYQVRLALIQSLSRLRNGDAFSVSIETLDDVAFETGGAFDLLQAKHHINAHANLTDASPDIWKTIRIWVDAYTNGTLDNDGSCFLITTSQAQSGSIAHYLQSGHDRDIAEAIKRMNSVAESSTSKTNKEAYKSYRALSAPQKESLLSCVFVMARSSTILDVEEDLKKELYHAVEIEFLEPFVKRLEGWWFRRTILQLLDPQGKWILSEELESEKTDLRNQFKRDSLPVDEDIMSETVDASGYQDTTFVHQLGLTDVGAKRIYFAIRDFYRAFTQRSRWISDSLVFVGELQRYEDRLVEEWELIFAQMEDELGEGATEEAKTAAAAKLYKWVESAPHPAIRERAINPMIARGTYHILSDNLRVGWHPNFVDRLKGLLGPVEARP